MQRRALRLPGIAFLAALLLWPAFWNGFPVIFADTGGYLARPHDGTLLIGRSALYGAFLAAGSSLAFWPNIAVQALLCVFAIFVVARTAGFGMYAAAAAVTILAVATGLPLYAAQLIPDIFAALAVLALYLLAFAGGALRRWEKLALGATAAFAAASHMAILALGLALLLAFAILAGLPDRRRPGIARPRLAPTTVALAAGIALALLSNLAIAGVLTFTPGGTSFIFGRLVQDGIVARYLADKCPDPAIGLCAYRNELPDSADGWLWGWGTPLYKLGGPEGYESEQRRIVLDTLRMYPGLHLSTALRATFDQLVSVRAMTSIAAPDNNHAIETFERLVPDLMPAVRAARQQREGVLGLDGFNAVWVPVALVSFALLPVVVVLGARGLVSGPVAALAVTVLFALLANAAINGIFSNPVDRYQSRLIWLATLTAMLAGAQVLKRRA